MHAVALCLVDGPPSDFDGITGNGFWGDALVQMGLPMSCSIKFDPKEENPVTPIDTWVRWNTFGIVNEHRESLEREPPIPLGAPDPWVPN